ncbi:MAG: cytochrome c oxidase subunit II [Desulfovibrionaceae bacterium]
MYPQVFAAAAQVDRTFMLIFGFSVCILVAVTATMLWFLWRYHYTRNPVPTDIKGSFWAELIWTVIPVCIVAGLFWSGWNSYKALRAVPADAMEIGVTARMWSWRFSYANGKRSNVLVAPLGRAVKLDMTSVDVIHSFYVPAMRIKMDTVPGMRTYVWFKADEVGEYDIMCAEYCGLKHANMITTLKVVPQDAFAEWLAGGTDEKTVALFDTHGCTGCHSLDGSEGAGPSLLGIAGRQTTVVFPDGEKRDVVADAAYLRQSILKPDATVVQGYDDIMPPYEGAIPDAELTAMVNYLLKGEARAPHPGRALAESEGCLSCHSSDGSEIAGPSFKGLYGSARIVLANGKEREVTADEAYIKESILTPEAAIVKGYAPIMPPYDTLGSEQVDTLEDYIKSLAGGAEAR